jgi:AraC-like DNA-binding protein
VDFEQMIAEISDQKGPLRSEPFPHYKDMDFLAPKSPLYTFYPDGSRSFSDPISMICKITADNSPIHSVLGAFPFSHKSGGIQLYFTDGFQQPTHKHNFVELDYVVEGQFYKQIEGCDYIFNKGDIILIDKDIRHTEYLYRKNSAVFCLRISNNFFDKSVHLNTADLEVVDFLQRFIINGNRKYHFVRYSLRDSYSRIPILLDQILSEMWKPHPGSAHLITGYVEWILNLLPLEHRMFVQWNNRGGVGGKRFLFEEVRQYLNSRYQNVSMQDLITKFGHNMNYFNQLIKRHTGMTYSVFLQDLRLRQAEFLLKTTDFPVEEIVRQVGYQNQSYFYSIFYKKFGMTPNKLRSSFLKKQ